MKQEPVGSVPVTINLCSLLERVVVVPCKSVSYSSSLDIWNLGKWITGGSRENLRSTSTHLTSSWPALNLGISNGSSNLQPKPWVWYQGGKSSLNHGGCLVQIHTYVSPCTQHGIERCILKLTHVADHHRSPGVIVESSRPLCPHHAIVHHQPWVSTSNAQSCRKSLSLWRRWDCGVDHFQGFSSTSWGLGDDETACAVEFKKPYHA